MERVPEFLIKSLENQYGKELLSKIIDGYKTKRKVSLRVNTIKSSLERIEKVLDENNIEYMKSSFWDKALIINNMAEGQIKSLSIYENGEIYLQSLSSMLPPLILNPKENEDILDMTAAPGGKTTEMADITNNKSHITACEMNKIRFERLKYNLEKQGAKCVYAMQKDSRQIDDFFAFDKVLLDAPCSGSGTLDLHDEKINNNFTEKLLQKSVNTQKKLINKAERILKKGGELVYSTCSILKDENEYIIKELIKTGKFEIIPISFNGIEKIPLLPTTIEGTICVMPTDLYEGFFVAKLKKHSLI